MVMTSKKKAAMEAASIEQGLRGQFEKETMLRDEHEELRKYIDDGLQQFRRDDSQAQKQPVGKFSSLNAEDRDVQLLKQAAGKVKGNQSKTETELLSEHMLAGIPEVDLGIRYRCYSNFSQNFTIFQYSHHEHSRNGKKEAILT